MALVAVGLPVFAGCSAATGPPAPAASSVVLRTDVPVHQPIWSEQARALFALTDDHRIAKIDPLEPSSAPATARTTLSAPFPNLGEDLVTRAAVVYLPQPDLGRLAVLSDSDLRQVTTLRAGPAPSFLALDSGADDLLALSQDRSRVTPLDLHDNRVLPAQEVRAEPGAELDGATRGRRIDYYLAGPAGIIHYKGAPGSVHDDGSIDISAGKTVSDRTKSSRLYVAERGTDRLLALDVGRGGHGLQVVAQASLGEPVRYLGVDSTRIYAATEHKLVVFTTNSFEGYAHQTFPIVTTIAFRSALRGAARNAALSGLAVGPDRVYLTLSGARCVLSITKPSI
jgi:hypothetical protein